jgi:hypothetical protein
MHNRKYHTICSTSPTGILNTGMRLDSGGSYWQPMLSVPFLKIEQHFQEVKHILLVVSIVCFLPCIMSQPFLIVVSFLMFGHLAYSLVNLLLNGRKLLKDLEMTRTSKSWINKIYQNGDGVGMNTLRKAKWVHFILMCTQVNTGSVA